MLVHLLPIFFYCIACLRLIDWSELVSYSGYEFFVRLHISLTQGKSNSELIILRNWGRDTIGGKSK